MSQTQDNPKKIFSQSDLILFSFNLAVSSFLQFFNIQNNLMIYN